MSTLTQIVFNPLQTVRSALEKADLVGTPFVPTNFRPSVFLQIEFPTTGASAQLGNTVTPAEGKEEPVISFSPEVGANPDQEYTLLSFDPDAPSREDQKFGPWRHWVLEGLKGKSLEQVEEAAAAGTQGGASLTVTKTKEAMAPWVAPSPGQGTGLHRYCFFLYKQSAPLTPFEENFKSNERIDRRNFDVAAFVARNNLELVGVNYFLCENP
ncbi:PEBP-like protein [Meredithblackwellia eburnea MCA 4105]